ncbi:unnamed protein product [Hermetia illucens]|uniref:Alcohol dehydrogenase n=1 Tax=Hermetia illucens TaxID=343691 RepID=A0A7R8UL60_HERIL|nr:alcohol dehydrogenase 2-like [Hermetia illucens]CAD7082880.1 unnamed protein product [Hermetia illucens]
MNCAGKSALIAGGLGGIGLATCNSLLRKGVKNLRIFDIIENPQKLKGLTSTYPKANVKFCKVDATKKYEIDNGFKTVLSDFKSVDIFVTCVGVVDEMHIERCIEINLLSAIYLNYAALEYMSNSKGGNGGIVANIASVAGVAPFPACVVYAATKHGVLGLTRSLGTNTYFKKTGIKFITICPGYTTTPLLNQFNGSPINDIKKIRDSPQQSPEICGDLLVEAIEKDMNGSIWLIDEGKLKEVTPPKL